MTRVTGSALMFNEDDVKSTSEFLPRLIRNAFFGLQITNDSYLQRYWHYYHDANPDKTRKEFSQKAAADRKFLLEPKKLTFNMMRSTLAAMGYDVQAASITVYERLTGEVRTFSTNDSIADLKRQVEEDNVIGIDSIV